MSAYFIRIRCLRGYSLIRCLGQEGPDPVLKFFFPHGLDPDDVPDILRGDQGKNETGKKDGRARPLKLSSLAIIKICATQFDKECDRKHHVERGKHDLVHDALDLLGRLRPRLLHRSRHIAACGKGRGAAERGQEQKRQRRSDNFPVFQNFNLLKAGLPPLSERQPMVSP